MINAVPGLKPALGIPPLPRAWPPGVRAKQPQHSDHRHPVPCRV